MSEHGDILEISNLSKVFGGLQAVNHLSFSVPQSKVTALIGPNGAGKTTVINMISGIYKPTSGSIKFMGEDITKLHSHEIARKGIARTFQITKLFPGMTVIENILLGREFGLKGNSRIFQSKTVKEEMDYAMNLLESFNLTQYANKMTRELSLGQQRWLELARAFAMEPKLLLLDEPASGLNLAEGEALLDKLRNTCAGGCTILLIEHNMRVMHAISDFVVVINFGQKLLTGTPDEIKNDPKVIEIYLGKELADA